MRRVVTIILLLVGYCVTRSSAFALIPLENLVTGEFSNQSYKDDQNNPINFNYLNSEKLDKAIYTPAIKKKMGIYRGFYQEGKNLDNLCASRPTVEFNTRWEREQVKLSMIATLQLIGLEVTSLAIGKYAQELKYSEREYENLVENIMGNYCSENTSVISLRKLKKQFYSRFKKNNFELPTVKDNPTFSSKLVNFNPRDQILEQELKMTLRLFQAFCSWGNRPENLRLLVPLVRNPMIQAFVIRQLSRKSLDWVEQDNKVFKVNNPDTVRVACDGLICRRVASYKKELSISQGIGLDSLEQSMRRLYCQDFRDIDFVYQDQEPKIEKIIKSLTFDQQYMMSGHFISLITGIPDFIVGANSFKDIDKIANSSVNKRWSDWANKKIKTFQDTILYEEQLLLEVVDRKYYFNQFERKFSVEIDVNVGEFDRSNSIVGKVSAEFNLSISRKFLSWVRTKWLNRDVKNEKETAKITERFEKVIVTQVEEAKKKFDLPPWEKGLEKIIVKELIEQVSLYQGDFFRVEDLTFENIPVSLNYGPFALKYLHKLRNTNIQKASLSGF